MVIIDIYVYVYVYDGDHHVTRISTLQLNTTSGKHLLSVVQCLQISVFSLLRVPQSPRENVSWIKCRIRPSHYHIFTGGQIISSR